MKKIVLMLTGLMAMSQVAMAEPTANYDREIMPIEDNLRIPNPWQEYSNLKTACQAAGSRGNFWWTSGCLAQCTRR